MCALDLVSILEKYAAMYIAVLKLGNGSNCLYIEHEISCMASLLTGGRVSIVGESHTRSTLSSFFGYHDGVCVYLLNTPILLTAVLKGWHCWLGAGVSPICREAKRSSHLGGVGACGGM